MPTEASAHRKFALALEESFGDLFRRHGFCDPQPPHPMHCGELAYLQTDSTRLKVYASRVQGFEFEAGPREPQSAWFESMWWPLHELACWLKPALPSHVTAREREALDEALPKIGAFFAPQAWRARMELQIAQMPPAARADPGEPPPAEASNTPTPGEAPISPASSRFRPRPPLVERIFKEPGYGDYLRDAGFVDPRLPGLSLAHDRQVAFLVSPTMRLRVSVASFWGFHFDAGPLRLESAWFERDWTSLHGLAGWMDPSVELDPMRPRAPSAAALQALHPKVVAFFSAGGTRDRERFIRAERSSH